MSSPFRILQVAHDILTVNEFCKFNDPRFEQRGIARLVRGHMCSPNNPSATMFTTTGAVARAACKLTEKNWQDCMPYSDEALYLMQRITVLGYINFIAYCDKLTKEENLKLIKTALELPR